MIQYPYNKDIEEYIIGCLITEKQDFILKLSEDDFYSELTKLIYKCLRYMKEKSKTIDMLSVADLISKKLENSLELISNIIANVHTTGAFESHLQQLQMYTTKRELLKKSFEIQAMIETSEHELASDLKSDVLMKLDTVKVAEDKQKEKFDSASIMLSTMAYIENLYSQKNEKKRFLGLDDIDRKTAGIHDSELTVIGARPAVGKTAFSLEMAVRLARKGNKVVFVTCEMSKEQIGTRLISNVGGVDGQKLRLPKNLNDKDWTDIAKASGEISNLPLEIVDNIIYIQELKTYCESKKLKGELDILIVDYLGLLRTHRRVESRRMEIEDITRTLKEMTRILKMPILCLAQLTRNPAKENRPPELTDLRDSGSIEQDADSVWFLHINEETTNRTQDVFETQVIIAKQRNGPLGTAYLKTCHKNFRYWGK